MEQSISSSPLLTGSLTSRPATMEDVPQLVDLVNEQSKFLYGESEDTVESWSAAWRSPGLDLNRDTRVLVNADGTILATSELWDIQPPHVWKYAYWRVRRGYEEKDYGKWALEWAEDRARQGVQLAPPDTRVVMSSRVPEKDAFAISTFRACAFNPVRRMDRMRISLDEPYEQPFMPDGIEIGTVLGEEELDKFLFALWESFADHWGHIPEPYDSFARRSRSFLENDSSMHISLCLLAHENGQPAGAAVCRVNAFGEANLGWINMLGVRRDWRKRGIGKALLLHAFSLLQSRGMRQAGLDVDSENLTGALKLYESVGLRTARSSVTFLKELRSGKDLTIQHLDQSS